MIALADAGVAVLDCVHATPKDAGEGFPYIAIPNVQDGRVQLEGVRRISLPDYKKWTMKTTPLPGDILVTRRGRVGDTAPIPVGLRCAIGQNLVLLRSDGEQVDQGYLRWATRGPLWTAEVDRLRNVGAVFDSLNVRDISRLRIPVPPLAEQRRIADVLGALDDLIDTNEQLKSGLDELARATFLRAWDGETWTTVAELGEVIMGQSPPGDTYSETPVGVPFHQGVRDFGARFPSARIYCSAPTRIAEAGDILIAVRAPVGEMNVAPERLAIGRGLAALRASRPATALQAIRASESTFSAHQGTGTVFSSINGKDLRSAKVPLVDDENVEAALSELDHAYAELDHEGAELRRTRDELLPLMMSGAVRVRPEGVAA